MTKYKLGSEMCGYTYDTLMKTYPSLSKLPFISKETFSTNQDDPSEIEDYIIVSISDNNDLSILKKTILKDISSTNSKIGFNIEEFDNEEIEFEKYNDLVITYD